MRRLLLLLLCLAAWPGALAPAAAQPAVLGWPAPALRPADRVRLAEARRIAEVVRDSLWAGWSDTPFALLLVTPEVEFLLWHPSPEPGFESLGYDPLLGSEVRVRPRVFDASLLATFPAVAGLPTIVVGQPERTGKGSSQWVLTLVHEHFHQYQTIHPDYYAGVAALELARGDRTGMWMLNFPFPYDSAAVQQRVEEVAGALRAAVAAPDGAEFERRLLAYRDARASLARLLPPDAERYLAFQLWQEGTARYTELRAARLAARLHSPSPAFRALPDFVPLDEVADSLAARVLHPAPPPLHRARRTAFYPLGAATALLLDRAAPGWQRRYRDGFDLEARFADPAARR